MKECTGEPSLGEIISAIAADQGETPPSLKVEFESGLSSRLLDAADAVGIDAITFVNVAVAKALNSVEQTGKLTVGIEG